MLVILTTALSLVVGLSTATASAPVGPHEATWSTTLDSTVTVDLGPLGAASMGSPVGPLGLEVVLGEIPSGATQADVVDSSALGESLSSDAASYIALVTHPQLTVERGLHALLHDGLRRAGVVEGVVLCLVAAAWLGAFAPRRSVHGGPGTGSRPRLSGTAVSTVAAVSAAFLAAAVVLAAPVLRPGPSHGAVLSALEGTPLEDAHFSGRIADVVEAYGPRVTKFLETNEAFYALAGANLRAAWRASQEVGGSVDVTAADGTVDTREVRARADSVAGSTAGGAGGAASPVPSSVASSTQTPAGAADGSPATGAPAASQHGAVTAVLSTDLHCNLDVIAFTGVLDEVSAADIHMDDGDLTMTGSDPEQLCVDALTSAVPASVAKVATIGNHDSQSTAARLRSQGWVVTDGTVQKVGGLRILGQDDPDRTTATGTVSRNGQTAEEVGAELAATSCTGTGSDVVLIHQPQAFGPLVSQGCSPLLLAGHVHTERGMTTAVGVRGEVSALVSGAGKGGTSLGAVTQDAYLHVLSFSSDGGLVVWRTVVLHPDASVTVGAWQPVPPAPVDQDQQADSAGDGAGDSAGTVSATASGGVGGAATGAAVTPEDSGSARTAATESTSPGRRRGL